MNNNNNEKDLKSELLLRCGCRLDVHAKCFENARTTLKLANGQEIHKYPCPCVGGKPQEVIHAIYHLD